MNSQYEVLSPWAEADPIPLRGISPRLTDLKDKKILALLDDNCRYTNSQIARKIQLSKPAVEYRLKRLEKKV